MRYSRGWCFKLKENKIPVWQICTAIVASFTIIIALVLLASRDKNLNREAAIINVGTF